MNGHLNIKFKIVPLCLLYTSILAMCCNCSAVFAMNTARLRKGVCSLDNNNVNNTSTNNNSCHMPP